MSRDPQSVNQALEKHLTAISERFRLMFAAGILFLFAGAQGLAEFSFGGITIARQRAYFSAALVSLFFSISVLDKFIRLRRLVALLDDSQLPSAVSVLSLHPWSGNPFSQLGSVFWRTKGVLIINFLFFSSFAWTTVFSGRRSGVFGCAPILLLSISSAIVWTFLGLQRDIIIRLTASHPTAAAAWITSRRATWIWLVVSIVLGIALYVWIRVFDMQIV